MKFAPYLLFAALATSSTLAQTVPAIAPPAADMNHAGSASMASILPDLDRLQAAAAQTSLDIGHMRIDKWKADGDSKRQAQSNSDSVQRNLTSALPGMIDGVRTAPQDLNAEFKLYRNVNALYDVMASLTESAGAFGARADYDALAQQLQVIDSVRRNLADAVERLTSASQSELTQLRTQVRTLKQAAAPPATPPKKVVVDDTQPAKKTVRKKKPASTSPDSSSGTGTAQQAPKS